MNKYGEARFISLEEIEGTLYQNFNGFENVDIWHNPIFNHEEFGITYDSIDIGETVTNNYVSVKNSDDKLQNNNWMGTNFYKRRFNSLRTISEEHEDSDKEDIETDTDPNSWTSIINSSIKKNFKPNPTVEISDFLPKRTVRTSTKIQTEYSRQRTVCNKKINKCKRKKPSKITKVRIGDIFFYENSIPFT